MVLRNYAPYLGVFNGTRVIVDEIGTRILKVIILTGPKKGNRLSLPRICCDSAGDGDLPFAFRRYQFPVKLAWAMTINKSQGQTFKDKEGLYLPRPVFVHGQLYVAFSRAPSGNRVCILADEYKNDQTFVLLPHGERVLRTLNIVNHHSLGNKPTCISDDTVKPMPHISIPILGKTSLMQEPLRKKRKDEHVVSALGDDIIDLLSWERSAAVEATPTADVEDDMKQPPSSIYEPEVDASQHCEVNQTVVDPLVPPESLGDDVSGIAPEEVIDIDCTLSREGELCTKLQPDIGDLVTADRHLETATTLSGASWRLRRGEHAKVVRVGDEDMFMLRSPQGLISDWTYRGCYRFVEN